MRLTDGTRRARIVLASDLAALTAFILAGMRSHRTGTYVEIFLRNAIPLGASWLVVAAAVRTYRSPSLRALLLTWAVAVPLGVALRTLWTDAWDRLWSFAGVAAAFTLLFLLLGRAVASLIERRLEPEGAG